MLTAKFSELRSSWRPGRGPGGAGRPADVRAAQQGGDVGPREGAGSQQAEEDGETGTDTAGENQILRHFLLLPPGHHRLLGPHVPRPLHSRSGPRNTHSGLRGKIATSSRLEP